MKSKTKQDTGNKKTSQQSVENPSTGIDSRNESEERYGRIDTSGSQPENLGQRERKFQEQRGLPPTTSSGEAGAGAGSKTEGAFGKDHTSPHDPINSRYRRDEVDESEGTPASGK